MIKPKIAIVDLLFQDPPVGGAGVDLKETFSRLADRFEVSVFYPVWGGEFHGGKKDFVAEWCEVVPVDVLASRDSIISSFVKSIKQYSPDLVFIGDGWTLKPFLAEELLKEFKCIVRLYAYEGVCPRNNERWLHTHKCDHWIFDDESKCLGCAKSYEETIRKHKNGQSNVLIDECHIADIYRGDYLESLNNMLTKADLIVYNSFLKNRLAEYGLNSINVVPGGANLDLLANYKSPKSNDDILKLLVYGRMDDSAKGAEVAIKAGEILYSKGVHFEMTITREPKVRLPWLKETGWMPREKILELASNSDISIVPSLWEEAFGMTWVESMAMKVPVIASDAAGPREYIVDGENGLLFEPGNSEELAKCILKLYNDRDLREKLTENGYKTVSENLTWDIIAEKSGKIIEKVLNI